MSKLDAPLGIKDIASVSKQGVPSIYRAIELGHLSTFLIGRRRYARESAVAKWLDYMQKQSDAGTPVTYRPRAG